MRESVVCDPCGVEEIENVRAKFFENTSCSGKIEICSGEGGGWEEA